MIGESVLWNLETVGDMKKLEEHGKWNKILRLGLSFELTERLSRKRVNFIKVTFKLFVLYNYIEELPSNFWITWRI